MDDAQASQRRAALLSAMYDAPEPVPAGQRPPSEDAASDASLRAAPDGAGLRKSRRMVMGAVAFDVPTVDYVESLERRAATAERVAAEQARHLKRLDILLSTLRHVVRRNIGAVADVARDLDGKLDRRD